MADLDERIKERAYAIWQSEGEPDGRDREFWHRAEAELASGDNSEAVAPTPGRAKFPRKRKEVGDELGEMAGALTSPNLDQAIEEANQSVRKTAGRRRRATETGAANKSDPQADA